MDTETSAAPRHSTVAAALFHVRDPLRRVVIGLRHLRSPYQRYRHARALHGVRVALALLTTLVLSQGLDLPHGVWASVSLLAVIGGLQHHGNIRKKAMERGLGTLLGAVAGLLLIVLDEWVGSRPLTFGVMALIAGLCAYHAIGRGGYLALLTAITMIIVGGQGDDSVTTGLWRTLQVCIGIAVALAFSFALPLNASYSWRYNLALNLRRAQRLIRRLQHETPLTAEARSATFADLSKRSIAIRGLMPSAAKEMNVTMALLEDIQHHHRAIVASLEMISSARLNATQEDQLAMSRAFRDSQGQAMRRTLLAIARALRAGDTSVLDTPVPDTEVPPAPTEPPSPAMQGPDWVMRQTTTQIGQLRHALAALPRQRNY
ncbi:FUSC family protein [Bordetella bronchialis]|uniref:FUSC family protein n=1 Tax=Bordetella bronchialis TaxID=463025 RepID=UPI0009F5E227|nr:FUSC family protein [Bordetella bronchialis]